MYPGNTDFKMIPVQVIMIIYSDTCRGTLLKISVILLSLPVSLHGHDKVDPSIKRQQLYLAGILAGLYIFFHIISHIFHTLVYVNEEAQTVALMFQKYLHSADSGFKAMPMPTCLKALPD